MRVALSIAVAAKGEVDPRPFLEALAAERRVTNLAIEIHVAHDGGWPAAAELGDSESLHVHACPPGTSILRLWGKALASARADYVAVLDVNCPPAPRWLAAAAEVVAARRPFAWGPVLPAPTLDDTALLAYIAEYCQFHTPLAAELTEIPGNNIVCRRELLAPTDELRAHGFEKTFMVWRLAASGVELQRCAELAIVFHKRVRWRHYVHRRALHGRCFGARRLLQHGQPPRWMCLLAAPALPLLRLWRIWRWARRVPTLRAAYWRCLPRLVVAETSWCWGELQGYCAGPGSSCERLD